MKTPSLFLVFLGIIATAAPCFAAAAATPLAGTWKLNPGQGTAPGSWSDITLTITVDGDNITLARKFTTGNRTAGEVIPIDAGKENIVPVSWWPDNRYIGVYIGGDKTRTIRASWLDDKRILRLSSDLVLATQQGDTPVNILSEYKVSHDGGKLTLVELRSSRQSPLVYYFDRVAGPSL